MREIRMLRSMWRGLETESRLGLHGHERGNPGHGQGHDLTDHRASPRPYHLDRDARGYKEGEKPDYYSSPARGALL